MTTEAACPARDLSSTDSIPLAIVARSQDKVSPALATRNVIYRRAGSGVVRAVPGVVAIERDLEVVNTGKLFARVSRLLDEEAKLDERENYLAEIRRRMNAPAVQNDAAHETKTLESYDWVNQSAGVARIPIAAAKKKLLEHGLPARPSAADPAVGTHAPAMAESSGGRTIKR